MSARTLYEAVESFQNMLVSHATGGQVDEAEFKRLRTGLLREPRVAKALPRFVRTCSDPRQFWAYIKKFSGRYQQRREHLWEEFRPLLQSLEAEAQSPADTVVAEALTAFDPKQVPHLWQRALERRTEDPEGAITLARTLLETVCKYILDHQAVEYPHDADLPALYRQTSESLSIAPSQHTAKVFKQVLGGVTSVVVGIGALRSRLGDAHGKGLMDARPVARHAELAVNLAGAMATFLCDAFAEQRPGS